MRQKAFCYLLLLLLVGSVHADNGLVVTPETQDPPAQIQKQGGANAETTSAAEQTGTVGQVEDRFTRSMFRHLTRRGFGQLTRSQLEHEYNVNEVEDWSALDADARDEAVSNLLGSKVSMDTNDEPVSGNVENGVLTLDNVPTANVDGVTVTDGTNFEYDSSTGTIKLESVGSLIMGNTIFANALNILGAPPEFHVDHADSIVSGCLIVEDVEASTITIFNDALQFEADGEADYDVSDCSNAEVSFKTDGGSMIVSKGSPGTYTVEDGNLSTTNDGVTETIEANNSVVSTYVGRNFAASFLALFTFLLAVSVFITIGSHARIGVPENAFSA